VFELEKGKLIHIGPFSFYLPDFSGEKSDVKVSDPEIPESISKSALVDKEAPIFTLPTVDGELSLTSLRGGPSVLSFVSTWSPPSVEQISVLDNLSGDIQVVAISTQESASKVRIFAERGGYDIPIVIDADGRLIDDYSITSLPTHFFLDRKGIVKRVVIGVLNKEEIENILTEIR
jgi:peroxiredoxin